MARKKKYADKYYIKGNKQGKPLTNLQKEMIVQAYALCGNKSQTARECGVTRVTVTNVLKQAETNKELQKARARALEDMAGQVHGKSLEILQSIGPEDIESGLIKKFDDDGQLVSAKSYGPSLMQKVTSAAILTDKLKVIQDTKQALLSDTQSDPNALPLPGTVQESLRMLGEKVKSLRILDIQFGDKHDDVVSKVQEVAHKAALHDDIEEADFAELDFDNP